LKTEKKVEENFCRLSLLSSLLLLSWTASQPASQCVCVNRYNGVSSTSLSAVPSHHGVRSLYNLAAAGPMRDGRIRLLAAVPPRAEDLPLFSSIAGWPFLGCLAKNAQKGERRACDVRREGKKTTSSVNDEKATTGLMAQRLDTTRKRGEENQKKATKNATKRGLTVKEERPSPRRGPFFHIS
jgi:hypothetical protein